MIDLINAARAGDKDASERLFVGIYDIVRLKALKLSNTNDYDDIAQDAIIRMMRVVGSFRGSTVEEFMAWVQWQVRSVATRQVTKSRTFSELTSEPSRRYSDRLEVIEQIERWRAVDATAVEFITRRIEGYSDDDIVQAYGLNCRHDVRTSVYRFKRKVEKIDASECNV